MAAFPKLKTGAAAQYPVARSLAYATDVHRFLDGSEQKYRVRGRPARRWGIQLELLDDTELAAIEKFFVTEQGRYGSFSFEDPWDSTLHSDCSFDQDEVAIELSGERRGQLRLVIRSNEG